MRTTAKKPAAKRVASPVNKTSKHTATKRASNRSSKSLLSRFELHNSSLTKIILAFALFGALVGTAFIVNSRAAADCSAKFGSGARYTKECWLKSTASGNVGDIISCDDATGAGKGCNTFLSKVFVCADASGKPHDMVVPWNFPQWRMYGGQSDKDLLLNYCSKISTAYFEDPISPELNDEVVEEEQKVVNAQTDSIRKLVKNYFLLQGKTDADAEASTTIIMNSSDIERQGLLPGNLNAAITNLKYNSDYVKIGSGLVTTLVSSGDGQSSVYKTSEANGTTVTAPRAGYEFRSCIPVHKAYIKATSNTNATIDAKFSCNHFYETSCNALTTPDRFLLDDPKHGQRPDTWACLRNMWILPFGSTVEEVKKWRSLAHYPSPLPLHQIDGGLYNTTSSGSDLKWDFGDPQCPADPGYWFDAYEHKYCYDLYVKNIEAKTAVYDITKETPETVWLDGYSADDQPISKFFARPIILGLSDHDTEYIHSDGTITKPDYLNKKYNPVRKPGKYTYKLTVARNCSTNIYSQTGIACVPGNPVTITRQFTVLTQAEADAKYPEYTAGKSASKTTPQTPTTKTPDNPSTPGTKKKCVPFGTEGWTVDCKD